MHLQDYTVEATHNVPQLKNNTPNNQRLKLLNCIAARKEDMPEYPFILSILAYCDMRNHKLAEDEEYQCCISTNSGKNPHLCSESFTVIGCTEKAMPHIWQHMITEHPNIPALVFRRQAQPAQTSTQNNVIYLNAHSA